MVENKWNYENDRGSDFTDETVVELIKPFYRQVNDENIKLIHHGTYNVFEIDDYIFRIPDKTLYNDKGYQLIHDEIKKLQFLRPRLSYLIPEPIFISDDPLKPLVGYRKIPGVSIEKIWAEIPEHNKLLLAKEIGHFLTEFHSVNLMQEYLKVFKSGSIQLFPGSLAQVSKVTTVEPDTYHFLSARFHLLRHFDGIRNTTF